VLLHMPTRVALLADPKQTEYTDFGAECEVVCQVTKRKPPTYIRNSAHSYSGLSFINLYLLPSQSVVPPNVVMAMAREGSAIVTVPLEVT
jgi:hypothetical protein